MIASRYKVELLASINEQMGVQGESHGNYSTAAFGSRSSRCPCRTSWKNSRLDAACLLCERRLMTRGPWSRSADAASWQISRRPFGTNFFGMVVDLLVNDEMMCHTVPVSVLSHGYAQVIHKLMCIAWAIWLFAWPSTGSWWAATEDVGRGC